MGIEYPDVKVVAFIPAAPESICCDIDTDRAVPHCGCLQMHRSVVHSRLQLVGDGAQCSRISLCLIEGKPPFGQERACSTENCVPRSQLTGVRYGCHPYLRHNASRKAPLCNVNPNSAMGRAVSQLDAPFSWARAMDLWREAERVGWSRLEDSFSCERLRLCISAWALSCSSRASGETVGIFSEIRIFKWPAIFREAENSPEQPLERSLKPMPASLLGSTRRSPSASLGGGLPVRAGMSLVRMVSSSGDKLLVTLIRDGLQQVDPLSGQTTGDGGVGGMWLGV